MTIDISKESLTSCFTDTTPVYFDIKVSGTPNILNSADHGVENLYYGEVSYFNPKSNSHVIIWFSHKYASSLTAYIDCYNRMRQYIADNPVIEF